MNSNIFDVRWITLIPVLFVAPLWAASGTESETDRDGAIQVAFADAECHRSTELTTIITKSNAEALFNRLHHEVRHVVDTVSKILSSGGDKDNETIEFKQIDDYGEMNVRVNATRQESGYSAQIRTMYSMWTGGHGGFGYTALDGVVCINLVISEKTRHHFNVIATVGLATGGAFIGVPQVEILYSAIFDNDENDLQGSIAGFDVNKLMVKQ